MLEWSTNKEKKKKPIKKKKKIIIMVKKNKVVNKTNRNTIYWKMVLIGVSSAGLNCRIELTSDNSFNSIQY